MILQCTSFIHMPWAHLAVRCCSWEPVYSNVSNPRNCFVRTEMFKGFCCERLQSFCSHDCMLEVLTQAGAFHRARGAARGTHPNYLRAAAVLLCIRSPVIAAQDSHAECCSRGGHCSCSTFQCLCILDHQGNVGTPQWDAYQSTESCTCCYRVPRRWVQQCNNTCQIVRVCPFSLALSCLYCHTFVARILHGDTQRVSSLLI